ncbi:Odorant receptor 403, partial [Nylanderia fulva]
IITTQNEIKTTMNDSMILSLVMVCTTFFVLIVLIPTVILSYIKIENKLKIIELFIIELPDKIIILLIFSTLIYISNINISVNFVKEKEIFLMEIFVGEVQYTVRYLICKSNITMACAVICGAFPLLYLSSAPFQCQINFFLPCQLCIFYLVVILIHTTSLHIEYVEYYQQIAWSAYSIPWFEKSHKTITNISILIQRSKKPLLISMGGMFPVLSIQYYANFIKTISSYFMTIRAAIPE